MLHVLSMSPVGIMFMYKWQSVTCLLWRADGVSLLSMVLDVGSDNQPIIDKDFEASDWLLILDATNVDA